jgi:hypothetical protein
MPDLPIVLIMQRLADRTQDELGALIDHAFESMCAALLSDVSNRSTHAGVG